MKTEIDWRLQAVTETTKDFKSPYSGTIIKKGTTVTSVSVAKLSKKKVIALPIPNATACCLNISKKCWEEAKHIRKKSKIDSSIKTQVHFESDSEAINYLEAIMQSIVFSFTALEAFVNELIPNEFCYIKKGKKCTETFSKTEIERWIQTDEKLGTILPEVLDVKSPRGNHKSWNEYQKLKNIRDRLIHMKSKDRLTAGPEDDTLWNELIRVEPPYQKAFSIIEYFSINSDTNLLWYKKYGTSFKK